MYKVFINDKPLIITGKLWDEFLNNHILIEAAGGVVRNKNGEFLIIYRRGKWDIPKGKAELGESVQNTALREVREETGLFDLTVKKLLMVTWHTYSEKKKKVLKKTHWFMMETSETILTPQTEEGIEKALWVKSEKFREMMMQSYASLRDMVEMTVST